MLRRLASVVPPAGSQLALCRGPRCTQGDGVPHARARHGCGQAGAAGVCPAGLWLVWSVPCGVVGWGLGSAVLIVFFSLGCIGLPGMCW